MAVYVSLVIFFLAFHSQRGSVKAQGNTASCDEELTAQTWTQILRSPNFPHNYTNNLHCLIHITAAEGTAIELEFRTFDLEDSEDCDKDVLAVYDGTEGGQRLVQHACGPHFAWPHYPDTVRSTSNAVTVFFETNGNNTGKGYEIYYRTVAPEQSILVFASQDQQRLHVIRRHSALNFGLFPDGIESPQAVDYDPLEGYVYYSDVATKVIGRVRINGEDTDILHRKKISNPFALRIDVVNRLLYWTDSDLGTISVSDLEGTQRQTLIDFDLQRPGAIVQEPNRGYIYFTDWGRDAKIEAAEGDGTNRRVLVDSMIGVPKNLAIDLDQRYLYWMDTLLDELDSIHVSGFGRTTLLRLHERDPFALVLDDDAFFFTNGPAEYGWIELFERGPPITGTFRVRIGSIREMRGISLRPLEDYGDTVPYTCPRADCNHLCLPKPNNNSICSQVLPILFVNCPSNITQTVPTTNVYWTEPIAYSPKGLTLTTTKSHSPGINFAVGIHEVSYKFEDTLCNRIYCNFTIRIVGNYTIKCPQNINENVPQGVTEAHVWWIPPVDSEGFPATESTHSPGELFPLGETVVTYTATSSDNIQAECSFKIFIRAEITGSIFLNCPNNIIKWVIPGTTATTVMWSTLELKNNSYIIEENQWTETGGQFYAGQVERVRLRAIDEFGNIEVCNFTVEVKVDDEVPTINCPVNISIELSNAKDRTKVDWPEPSAFDNSGNVTVTLLEGPNPNSLLSAGTATVKYKATDFANNTATCTFVVDISVKDDENNETNVPTDDENRENNLLTGDEKNENDFLTGENPVIILFGGAISVLLVLLLCAILFASYRCRRRRPREVERGVTNQPPVYSYALNPQVNSVSLGVGSGAVQYRTNIPEEPLYDVAAVGPPPAYEEEKKVDLSDEKDLPPGYQ